MVFITVMLYSQLGEEGINVTVSLIAKGRLSPSRSFGNLQCGSVMTDILNAAQPHRIILDIGCSIPKAEDGLPSILIEDHGLSRDVTDFFYRHQTISPWDTRLEGAANYAGKV